MHETKKDADDEENIFKEARLPRRWMGTIKLLVLAGGFFGGIIYSFKDKKVDSAPRHDAVIDRKITELVFQVESLRGEIDSIKTAQEDADREIRRSIQGLLRKIEGLDNQSVEDMRHDEIMGILRYLDKRRK